MLPCCQARQRGTGTKLPCYCPAREVHLRVCTVLDVETQASADRHGESTWFGYAEISRRAWSVVWAIRGGTHRTGHRSTKGAPVNAGRAECRSTIETSFSVCSQWYMAPATPDFGSTHTHTHTHTPGLTSEPIISAPTMGHCFSGHQELMLCERAHTKGKAATRANYQCSHSQDGSWGGTSSS